MAIPLTDLDDVTYADLVAQARSLIPALHPGWTDHNPSDPGIALVELLAWLTEMLSYQVNEIPPSYTRTFLSLLNGPGWSWPDGPDADASLDDAVRASLATLGERYRAATSDDYEHLVTQVWPASPEAAPLGNGASIRRVRCVAGRDLVAEAAGTTPDDASAHVSVVILPASGTGIEHPQPAPDLTAAMEAFLEPRRLLAVRQHVTGPRYVDVRISADLALNEDSPPATALASARDRLISLLSPAPGGAEGNGRAFGRSIYTSEVYAALEELPLVDYIENVQVSGPPPITAPGGTVTGVQLDEHELARLITVDLVAYDAYDQSFPLHWTRS